MSRAPQTPEQIAVPAGPNIYTVLALIGLLAGLIGLGVMFMRAKALGVELF